MTRIEIQASYDGDEWETIDESDGALLRECDAPTDEYPYVRAVVHADAKRHTIHVLGTPEDKVRQAIREANAVAERARVTQFRRFLDDISVTLSNTTGVPPSVIEFAGVVALDKLAERNPHVETFSTLAMHVALDRAVSDLLKKVEIADAAGVTGRDH